MTLVESIAVKIDPEAFEENEHHVRRMNARIAAQAALSAIEAAGMVCVPKDDETREVSDSALPFGMIDAGITVLEGVHADHQNYVAGITPDWDDGMVAVAVYRAMTAAKGGE
jgi:hypothetical protein